MVVEHLWGRVWSVHGATGMCFQVQALDLPLGSGGGIFFSHASGVPLSLSFCKLRPFRTYWQVLFNLRSGFGHGQTAAVSSGGAMKILGVCHGFISGVAS
jgi:hypothetical protein